jgi:hypothetical protein
MERGPVPGRWSWAQPQCPFGPGWAWRCPRTIGPARGRPGSTRRSFAGRLSQPGSSVFAGRLSQPGPELSVDTSFVTVFRHGEAGGLLHWSRDIVMILSSVGLSIGWRILALVSTDLSVRARGGGNSGTEPSILSGTNSWVRLSPESTKLTTWVIPDWMIRVPIIQVRVLASSTLTETVGTAAGASSRLHRLTRCDPDRSSRIKGGSHRGTDTDRRRLTKPSTERAWIT